LAEAFKFGICLWYTANNLKANFFMKNNKLKISKRAQNVIASPIRKFLPLINEARS
jgi:hypothetical protein